MALTALTHTQHLFMHRACSRVWREFCGRSGATTEDTEKEVKFNVEENYGPPAVMSCVSFLGKFSGGSQLRTMYRRSFAKDGGSVCRAQRKTCESFRICHARDEAKLANNRDDIDAAE